MKLLKKKNPRHLYLIRNRIIMVQMLITITSLVLCGIVMFISSFINIEQYIENDINYFLKTTNKSLSDKVLLLENLVISMRNDNEIMEYAQKASEGDGSQEKMQALSNKFTRYTDLYSNDNVQENDKPFMETIYFFDNQNNYLSVNYYPLRSDEMKQMNDFFLQLQEQFLQHLSTGGKDYYFIQRDGHIYICWGFYDNQMKRVGTLFFSLRQDSISEVMQHSNNYEDSFWTLFEEDTGIIFTNKENKDSIKENLISCMGDGSTELTFDNRKYLVNYQSLSMGIHVMFAVPQDHVIFLLFETYQNYILTVVLVILASIVLIGLFISRLTKPLSEFTDKIRKVKEGDFKTKLPSYHAIEFQEISQSFNAMTDEIDHLVCEVYEKQLLIREQELKFMQSQMNPHFMFNVLNSIALQARLNNDVEVFQLISNFSRLLQAIIYQKDKEKVTIRQELEYVDYYLTLQRYRYGDRMEYQLNVHDETVLDYYIPKLCLQLIVENAVVHGIEPKKEKSLLTLDISSKNGVVQIVVQDDGVGFDGADENGEIKLPLKSKESTERHNRIGLNNAYNIMKIMYGDGYGIRIFSKKGEGTKVIIKIPFDSLLK